MTVSPRTLAIVSVLGGGCLGVPLILWQEGFWSKTSPKITSNTTPKTIVDNKSKVSRKLSTIRSKPTQTGGCNIEDLSADYADFLVDQGKAGEMYIELSCENTNDDTSSGSLSHNWTGLFPEELFTNNDSFEIGQKLNIRTVTTGEAGKEITTFKGGGLKSEFTGSWGEQLKTKKDLGESVTPVVVSETNKANTIYWISG